MIKYVLLLTRESWKRSYQYVNFNYLWIQFWNFLFITHQ